MANHYYMHYLATETENPGSLKTKGLKLKTENLMTTSTSQFQQVVIFSLLHCALTVPQTKKRRALSVKLTHSNKTEMAYQVMKNENHL
jgi:hypothetical protein